MVDLLRMAVDAHGGMANWRNVRRLSARLTIGGRLWTEKGQAARFDSIDLTADLHRQRVTMKSTRDDWCSEFTPSVITLSRTDGTLIDTCAFPRQVFLSSANDRRWHDIQAAYLSSYALWTFVTIPFRYTEPDFSVEELPPWREDDRSFRRLRVIFPDAVQEHRREHVTYFDEGGKLWRHDCSSDAGGIVPGATYASEYQRFEGIALPLTRCVYAYDSTGRKVGDALVEVHLSDVTLR